MKTAILVLLSIQLFSQIKKPDTVFCDCNMAKTVKINGKAYVGPTIAPKGFGEINEISGSKQNTKFAFEKEHNTAWYKLIINATGKLIFDITPLKPDDDYDFMLFKSSATTICDSLLNYKVSPVRACISRNQEDILGKTGLDHLSKETVIKKGVNTSYGKAIEVKAGEIYYLVLDNVYDNGEGHKIKFEISELMLFKGTITNELNEAVKAEISITNQRGDVVLLEKTKPDGTYNFTQTIISSQPYALNFYNDSSFNYTKVFTSADTVVVKSLKTILPKLKKGSKYSVGAINFVGNSAQYLPRSVPAMNNLYRLLNKNPNLKIRIIGHSNGRYLQDEKSIVSFTKGRARSVRNYLAIQGISEKRIEIDGKGDHEMLFPFSDTITEEQQEQNRRVEILVTEY